MRIEPDKWLEEYEASLAEAREMPLHDYERKGLLRALGWLANMSDEHQAEAVCCLAICALRAVGEFYSGALSRAEAWLESAELGSDPEFCAAVQREQREMCEAAEEEDQP